MILRGIGASGGVGMGPAVCLRAAAPDRAGRGYAGVGPPAGGVLPGGAGDRRPGRADAGPGRGK